MALITRINRLFKADMHAVLDRLEEPGIVLQQAIREMESQLAGDAQKLKSADAEHRQLAERSRHCDTAQARIAGELDLCFAAGNEPLARLLLRRRLQSERLQRQLARRLEALAAEIEGRRRELEERRRRLDELRDQAAVFETEPGGAEQVLDAEDCSVSEADVELALLAEHERRRVS